MKTHFYRIALQYQWGTNIHKAIYNFSLLYYVQNLILDCAITGPIDTIELSDITFHLWVLVCDIFLKSQKTCKDAKTNMNRKHRFQIRNPLELILNYAQYIKIEW